MTDDYEKNGSTEARGEEALFVISVAARLADVHPQTLRMYERRGLICPRRTTRKRRMYSERDVERLRRIQRMTQEMGLNLAGVELALDLLDKLESLQQELEQERSRLRFVMERYQELASEAGEPSDV